MGPLHGVTSLREKHRYNITPWARKLSDDDDSETEEDERLAVAAAMFSMAQRIKKGDCHFFNPIECLNVKIKNAIRLQERPI